MTSAGTPWHSLTSFIFSGVSRKDGKSSRRTSLTSVSPNEVHAAHARLPGLSTRADHCAPISRLVASPYTLPELWRSLTTSTKIIMKFCVPTWVCTFAMYSFPWLNTCTRHLPVPIARRSTPVRIVSMSYRSPKARLGLARLTV